MLRVFNGIAYQVAQGRSEQQLVAKNQGLRRNGTNTYSKVLCRFRIFGTCSSQQRFHADWSEFRAVTDFSKPKCDRQLLQLHLEPVDSGLTDAQEV